MAHQFDFDPEDENLGMGAGIPRNIFQTYSSLLSRPQSQAPSHVDAISAELLRARGIDISTGETSIVARILSGDLPRVPSQPKSDEMDLQTYLRSRHLSCINTLTKELQERANREAEKAMQESLIEEWQQEKLSILRGLHHSSFERFGGLDVSVMKKRGRESDMVIADSKHFAPTPRGNATLTPASKKILTKNTDTYLNAETVRQAVMQRLRGENVAAELAKLCGRDSTHISVEGVIDLKSVFSAIKHILLNGQRGREEGGERERKDVDEMHVSVSKVQGALNYLSEQMLRNIEEVLSEGGHRGLEGEESVREYNRSYVRAAGDFSLIYLYIRCGLTDRAKDLADNIKRHSNNEIAAQVSKWIDSINASEASYHTSGTTSSVGGGDPWEIVLKILADDEPKPFEKLAFLSDGNVAGNPEIKPPSVSPARAIKYACSLTQDLLWRILALHRFNTTGETVVASLRREGKNKLKQKLGTVCGWLHSILHPHTPIPPSFSAAAAPPLHPTLKIELAIASLDFDKIIKILSEVNIRSQISSPQLQREYLSAVTHISLILDYAQVIPEATRASLLLETFESFLLTYFLPAHDSDTLTFAVSYALSLIQNLHDEKIDQRKKNLVAIDLLRTITLHSSPSELKKAFISLASPSPSLPPATPLPLRAPPLPLSPPLDSLLKAVWISTGEYYERDIRNLLPASKMFKKGKDIGRTLDSILNFLVAYLDPERCDAAERQEGLLYAKKIQEKFYKNFSGEHTAQFEALGTLSFIADAYTLFTNKQYKNALELLRGNISMRGERVSEESSFKYLPLGSKNGYDDSRAVDVCVQNVSRLSRTQSKPLLKVRNQLQNIVLLAVRCVHFSFKECVAQPSAEREREKGVLKQEADRLKTYIIRLQDSECRIAEGVVDEILFLLNSINSADLAY